MFKHVDYLQFQAKPEKPDALFAMKLQELVGGQFGEMTVMMQYLWQGWTCRVPGKYKDMIMDIATEEIGHVEMLTTMLARLLEGAPAEKAVAANPVLAAVIGGMNPQHAIATGGNALPRDSWANGANLIDGRPIAHVAAAPLTDDKPLGPAPDPRLFVTYDGSQGPGKTGGGVAAHAQGVANVVNKIKGALD
ncbi:manganese catalase family protein [Catenuloplanes sp. NPDC051500]|uniref:manganese catalase family protein n=1 Tax=Catenuloplanes sp. NPDC051500 TaxID=3363959 RepID=UPI003787D85E